jgi:hypothetical protein
MDGLMPASMLTARYYTMRHLAHFCFLPDCDPTFPPTLPSATVKGFLDSLLSIVHLAGDDLGSHDGAG